MTLTLLQDVKTYTAACLAHVLRLHTADCPYSPSQQQVQHLATFHLMLHCWCDAQSHASWKRVSQQCRHWNPSNTRCTLSTHGAVLQAIFGLFMWIFRRLENANAPAFQMCHSILDVVSQVGTPIAGCLLCTSDVHACQSEGLQGIRRLTRSILRHLDILQPCLQTKCCLLMLDLDGADDMICDLFRVLFDVIK